jgi:hypothetical protein
MAFALRLLRIDATSEELAALADRYGQSSFAGLRAFALTKGLHAEAFSMTPAQLAGLHRVAILQLVIRRNSSDPWREHFVTFAGPGRTPGTVAIFDSLTQGGAVSFHCV